MCHTGIHTGMIRGSAEAAKDGLGDLGSLAENEAAHPCAEREGSVLGPQSYSDGEHNGVRRGSAVPSPLISEKGPEVTVAGMQLWRTGRRTGWCSLAGPVQGALFDVLLSRSAP